MYKVLSHFVHLPAELDRDNLLSCVGYVGVNQMALP